VFVLYHGVVHIHVNRRHPVNALQPLRIKSERHEFQLVIVDAEVIENRGIFAPKLSSYTQERVG